MRFLTLGSIKSAVARGLGMCSTDSRVVDFINEAQERLLNRENHAVGSFMRYRFCTNESCLVLPRSIRTVESFAVCERIGEVRPYWYEFLGNGTHIYDEDDTPGTKMIDHGITPVVNSMDPGKSVTLATLSAAGSGYTSAPTVTFTNDSDDTTGDGAEATATVVGGAVTAVTITNSGSGYTVAPDISFSGGAGSGAAAAATIARNRLVRVLSRGPEDSGLEIRVCGYDDSGNYVRTTDSGTRIDGEKITISNTATNSSTIWSDITRIEKPETDYVVDVYSWDSTASVIQRTLGSYEPSETIPTYRKMFVPGIQSMARCDDAAADCDNKDVTVLARMQHVPVSVDNDFMTLQNVAAIKLMTMAIQREEQERFKESQALEVKAQRELDGELAAFLGSGNAMSIKHEDNDTSGAGVFSPI